jgi:hypothetical protein
MKVEKVAVHGFRSKARVLFLGGTGQELPRPSMPAESRLATSSPLARNYAVLSPTRQGGGKFDIGQWPA